MLGTVPAYVLAALLSAFSLAAAAETLDLNSPDSLHISFKRIPATTYSFEHDTLLSRVDKSASFILIPFKTRKTVASASYEWKLESGKLELANADQETRRKGDDAVFKLGLLIEGKPEFPNPLAPAWLKQANAALSLPSGSMVYLVANARHAAGESWTSPYNSRIRMIASQNTPLADGWSRASITFDTPLSVVGLWLMADGDNTQSSFSSRVKNIGLE